MLDTKKSLAETIRAALEEEIFTGVLPSGSQLDEQQLVDRFGVSRTPAREALLQLAAAGLVTIIPRQGAVVSSITLREYVGFSEVLTHLEALAAQLATRRMSADEHRALEKAFEACRSAAQASDVEAYKAANAQFHTVIYEGAHNDYLNQQLRMLRARMRGMRDFRFEQPARVKASLNEHQAVMESILAGDEESASRAMTQHISAGGNVITDMIAAQRNETDTVKGKLRR
jgi:DNA-binding GntR family transcriptional regulator